MYKQKHGESMASPHGDQKSNLATELKLTRVSSTLREANASSVPLWFLPYEMDPGGFSVMRVRMCFDD
jgi:hypothetical protein